MSHRLIKMWSLTKIKKRKELKCDSYSRKENAKSCSDLEKMK